MATVSQRLHRLGDNGYETWHLETNSSIVRRPDGSSVEDALVALAKAVDLFKPMISDVLPSALEPGKVVIVGANIYIADATGTPVPISVSPDVAALAADETKTDSPAPTNSNEYFVEEP